MQLRHVLRSDQYDWEFLEKLFGLADRFRAAFHNKEGGRDWLRKLFVRRLLFYVFFEKSTRTRLSFCAAAFHLGMTVEGTDNAAEFSSFGKGETMQAGARVLSGYEPDVIVMRTKEDDGAEQAAEMSLVPIINGGGGKGEHPTQSMLDLYTIWRRFGRLENLHGVIGGDLLRGRTVRSLLQLHSRFPGVKYTLISPKELALGDDMKGLLRKRGVEFSELHAIEPEAFSTADFIYWTRAQVERKEEDEPEPEPLVISLAEMAMMGEQTILMHPLPHTEEIDPEIYPDPRTYFFEQSDNGLWVRMALLHWVITGHFDPK